MLWIGLTGGIASGKTTVGKFLRELGFPVIDADQLAHEVLLPNGLAYADVIKAFGFGILDADKKIDRKKLGELVFKNTESLRKLEQLVHPHVQSQARKHRIEAENQGHEMAFYDVPLLFEKNLTSQFDKTIVVACEPRLQKLRLIERNQMSDADAELRLKAQLPIEEKVKLADFVIDNSASLAELRTQTQNLIQELGDNS